MSNIKVCPMCGCDEFGRRWVKNRKIQKYCKDCDWVDEPRIPEQKDIKTEKVIACNRFSGFYYEIFDRYGYIMTSSRSYTDSQLARESMSKELIRGRTDINAGPYTGVLWPDTVLVKGQKYTYN